MRLTARASAAGLLLLLAGVACGGPRSTSLAPSAQSERSAPLTLRVRVPAAFAGKSLAATVYADGAREPLTPSGSIPLASSACALAGGERVCTLRVGGPVGVVDVALHVAAAKGGATLDGTALRRLLSPGGSSLSAAFDGTASRWSFSPEAIVAAADGTPHDVPFAVQAEDAQGFVLLAKAPQPPPGIAVDGDVLHQLSLAAQGGGAFLASYGGQPVGKVTLSAAAPGAATATAAFASLVVNPAVLDIPVGKAGTLSASLAHYAGPFEASSGENCTVTPASATPASPGAVVQFEVHLLSAQGCSVKIQAAQFQVPIVIPAKNAIARPGIGIGPAKIQHVVVLFQENRSFDNIFGGLDNNGNPFPGADTVSNPNPGEPTPHDHFGNPIPMSTGLLEECYDPYHDHPNSVTDVDGGQMNGFDKETIIQETCAPNPAPSDYVYRTMEYNEVQPYWSMGEQYAISDRMFEPFSSGSYGPHLYVVAGQSANTIDNPSGGFWGCDNVSNGTVDVMNQATGGEIPGVFPCFTAATLGDVMDQNNVSWRYYATNTLDFGYDWSAYDSFNDIRNGPDWTAKVINPPAQIITDVGNGTLAAMTWVTPTNVTSDHPQAHSNLGPAWIASVVDAIGESQFWDSTAIFITWDDWGGWYDHVPPPVTNKYFSLGIRVPLIIVSPYAKAGYVSHVTHTTGSILHFAENVFDLPSLGEEDARQDNLMDAFNFSQAPIPFQAFAHQHSKAEVMRAATQSTRTPEEGKVGD